jgi:DTW domain-containing protein YfiP
MSEAFRDVCLRCRRPRVVCYCAHLTTIETRTRLVFLQHPREARMPVGTARMAHLALPNSELHVGVTFGEDARLRSLTAMPGTALLFPGEGALPPEAVGDELKHLIVIDGTWAQAKKVLKQNPLLQTLPRIGLTPTKPGNYRIRKEPTPEALATIEAVADVLGSLEGERPRFEAMLAAFTWMVDRQIDYASSRSGPPRRWVETEARLRKVAEQRSRLARAVVMHGEVNAHSRGSDVAGEPELVHFVAQRAATGELFEAFLRPRRPLGPNVPFQLKLSGEWLVAGETIEAFLSRWRAWLRTDDVLCGWGPFTRQKLVDEGDEEREWMDLRYVTAMRLQRRPGSPLEALRLWSDRPPSPAGHGRAGELVGALSALVPLLTDAGTSADAAA